MKTSLKNILEVIEGAERVRNLSFLEKAIKIEVQKGLNQKTYSRKDVLALLKRQIKCSAGYVGRMSSRAGDLEIMQKLNEIKPIKF